MRLHYKQGSWSQICEDTRPSYEYLHKTTKKMMFFLYINIYQDEKYVGSYEEIKFKKGVESKLISEN